MKSWNVRREKNETSFYGGLGLRKESEPNTLFMQILRLLIISLRNTAFILGSVLQISRRNWHSRCCSFIQMINKRLPASSDCFLYLLAWTSVVLETQQCKWQAALDCSLSLHLTEKEKTSLPAPPSIKHQSCKEVLVIFLSVFRMPILWRKGLGKALDAKIQLIRLSCAIWCTLVLSFIE